MLRKLCLGLALLGTLALGACVTPGGAPVVGAPGTIDMSQPLPTPGGVETPSTAISKIQAATVKACGFLPAANFLVKVAASFTSYGEAVSYAQSIATGICAQVAPTPSLGASYAALTAGKKRPKGEIRGVPIEGKFVDRK